MKRVCLFPSGRSLGYVLKNQWAQNALTFEGYVRPFYYPELEVLWGTGCFVEQGGIALKSPWQAYPESCRFIGPVKASRRVAWMKTYMKGERLMLFSPVVSLVNHRYWHQNYFHWLMDVLAILLVASEALGKAPGEFKVLVPGDMRPFQKQSLDTLGVPESMQVRVKAGQKVVCENGLLLSGNHRFQTKAPGFPATPIHPELPRLFKHYFSELRVGGPNRRLLIERAPGTPRAYTNYEAVAAFAQQYDYERVDLDKLSFSEQVALFSQASEVIGVHGAGMTNLLFASHCRVLEIHSSAHGVRDEYFQLTSLFGGDYRFIVMEGNESDKSVMFPVEVAKAFASGA